VTAQAIRDARERIASVLEPSPVEPSRALSDAVGVEVLIKCENLQRTGSFKLRGAYNRISLLTERERALGVVCASAGNHAQGVALAAKLLGVQATIYMPEAAPLPKVEATRSYGAEVRLLGASFDDSLAAATEFAATEGRIFVHPFDHPDIIAGQGTIGLELLEQVPEMATVVVPMGGGGLVSGIAVAVKDQRPDVHVVGVQAAGCASFPASLDAGAPRELPRAQTIADGIAVKKPGEITLAHVAALVDEVVVVDEDSIARALVLLLERAKLVAEGAAAASVAAILEKEATLTPPVVAIVSGGNIDPLLLQHVVTSGLAAAGRYVSLRTRVADRPGELHRLLGMLAEERANVVAVEHHRFGRRLRLEEVEVVLELETRGHEHIEHIKTVLRERGYLVGVD